MIQILKQISLVLVAATVLVLVSVQAAAALPTSATNFAAATCAVDAKGVPTEVPLATDDNVCCPIGSNDSSMGCLFAKYINPAIALIAAAVGIVVVVSIIIGGIQYSSAQGDPSKVQAAKQRIMNSLIALVAFFFLFAAIQWLVPGGVL